MAPMSKSVFHDFPSIFANFPAKLAVVVFLLAATRTVECTHAATKPLYDERDKVVILDATNFQQLVVDRSETAWFIEFYSSWCGHCINFAPKWKEFANETYAWRNVIRIGGIDCANEINTAICRDYEVMAYPTLKLFAPTVNMSPSEAKSDLGQKLKGSKESSETLRKNAVEFVRFLQEQNKVPHATSWPDLRPVSNSFEWSKPHAVLVVVDAVPSDETEKGIGSQLAGEIALDLDQQIAVRWLDPLKNEHVATLLFRQSQFDYPNVVLVKPNGEYLYRHQLLGSIPMTRTALVNAVRSWMGRPEQQNVAPVSAPPKAVPIPSSTVTPFVPRPDDVVYLSDLERSLRYSLTQEIGIHKIISGEQLAALRSYIALVVSSFPARPQLLRLLEDLASWVWSANEIGGADFDGQISMLSRRHDIWTEEEPEWLGCRGSDPRYRGYPCSLWMTFHTLVAGAPLHAADPLQAILGYVTHFFSCRECATNFQAMAAEGMPKGSGHAQILWLWQAHNRANKRLSGDLSEDPFHKKYQFPSSDACPSCQTSGTIAWDQAQVVSFLKNMYGKDKISFDGMPEWSEAETRHAWSSSDMQRSVQHVPERGTWLFSFADVGLCVGLYLLSAVVLIAAFLKFVLRNRTSARRHGYLPFVMPHDKH